MVFREPLQLYWLEEGRNIHYLPALCVILLPWQKLILMISLQGVLHSEHSPLPGLSRYTPPPIVLIEADWLGHIPLRCLTVGERSFPPRVSRYTPPPLVPIEADRPSHIPEWRGPHTPSRWVYPPAVLSTAEEQIRYAGDTNELLLKCARFSRSAEVEQSLLINSKESCYALVIR